ncbi:gas vesicle protein K [Egicoccus sp. AB-alg2]|uniref:gas vesicle protein K n=1 Tax=Egicoccus sp. AB-alg2 TaxID=3242693 RepID=UPI00359E675C
MSLHGEDPLAGLDLGRQLDRLLDEGRAADAKPENLQRGLAALVLTLVELLRDLMERQAVRRMERGTLTDDEVERLGEAFLALRERIDELCEVFDLDKEDLTLDLGPLGRLR